MKKIINNLLDTDLYKFKMLQFMWKHNWDAPAKTVFINRGKGPLLIDISCLRKQIKHVASLWFDTEDLEYLASLGFDVDFLDWLGQFRLNDSNVRIDEEGNIAISGNILYITLWETFILSIISEMHNYNLMKTKGMTEKDVLASARKKLKNKIDSLEEVTYPTKHPLRTYADQEMYGIVDFGTRRRFSFKVQDYMIRLMGLWCKQFKGTSNVFFAKKYKLPCIGTMAHEINQIAQVVYPEVETSQMLFLQDWLDLYPKSAILTDTLTTRSFVSDLKECNINIANSFSRPSFRHDSGDPTEWYHSIRSVCDTFDVVFSDGVTFESIPSFVKIVNDFKCYGSVTFGIGTNLTNDIGGLEPLNIVVKLVEYNGKPVAKISDSPGKEICLDSEYLERLKSICKAKEAKLISPKEK